MKDFRDRVALVTGGGSGIGAALARAFAAEGARLVLADVDEAGMEEVAAGLRASGTDVLCVRTDVSRLEDVQRLADAAYARFGAVHVLCNNAGVAIYGGLESMSHDDWRWVVGVNLWGVIHGVEVFVPRMIEKGEGGHVLNTGSLAGLVPMQGMGVYVTTKYAVVGLSETLHRDLSGHGIGVTVLCPMVVDTRINFAERNRPAELGGGKPIPETDPTAGMDIAGGVLPPETVARRALDAIRAGELYVLTHAASRDIIRRRFERIDRAAARREGGG